MKQTLYIFLVLPFWIAACHKESIPSTDSPSGTIDRGDSISITLQVNVPTMEDPVERSTRYLPLSPVDETHIVSCYVFAFAVDPHTGIETYSYMPSVVGSVIGNNAAKEITINLQKGLGVDHRFVFLMNIAPSVEPIIELFRIDPDRFSKTKAEVLALMSSPAVAVYDYYLPMWCESQVVEVSESTAKSDLFIGGVAHLIRSMAGVNITNVAPKFTLETVSFYYTRTKAAYAPADVTMINTSPTVDGVVNTGGVGYILSTAQLTAQTIVRNIYLAEAHQNDQTSMIFGGKYDGSTVRTYYKFDFRSIEDLPLHILRNHLYQVRILSVVGDGYVSEAEALNRSIPLQTFKAQVIPWTLQQGDPFADGSLAVSTERMVFDFRGGTRTLSVFSSLPFTVDGSALPAGFSVSPLSGVANTKVDLLITIPDAGGDLTNISTQVVISHSKGSKTISIEQIRDQS